MVDERELKAAYLLKRQREAPYLFDFAFKVLVQARVAVRRFNLVIINFSRKPVKQPGK